jgi:hypothetical protein
MDTIKHNKKVKKFIEFLQKNKIDTELFMYYTRPENNGFKYKKYKHLSDFFENENCENWIKYAFRWDITKFKNLDIINKKWELECSKKSKIKILEAIPKWIKKIKGD